LPQNLNLSCLGRLPDVHFPAYSVPGWGETFSTIGGALTVSVRPPQSTLRLASKAHAWLQ
jgi:hypothetical protein